MAVFRRISNNIRYSDLFTVFNWKEDRGKGRCCMLFSTTLSTIITDITSGTLYTAFLTINGFSIVDVGVISLLPLIAACFALFSPAILERFPRRRWILAIGRIAYYVINILGLTLLPYIAHDPQHKLIGFGVLVFLGSVINNLFASGYSVWHLNFIPNDVRAKYLSSRQTITALCSYTVLLISGAAADALHGQPGEGAVLIILRLVAFLLAMGDVVILSLPKEYPYPSSGRKVRMTDVFRLPAGNRKFMLTMGIICFWTFLSHLPAASWSYYLLNTAQTGVTLINVMNFLYAFFLLAFTPMWQRILRKRDWFGTFVLAAFLHTPTVFACAFITVDNRVWLYVVIRIIQHLVGVGLNLAYANFAFINTPSENQTCYLSFHLLSTNLIAFLGQLCGTLIVQWMGDATLPFFGVHMSAPQVLMLMQGGLMLLCTIWILYLLPQITPKRE